MRPKITVLQDHTAFFSRIYQCALDDYEAKPLNQRVLEAIQARMLGVLRGGRWVPIGELQTEAKRVGPEGRKAAIQMAEAVEGEVEQWLCVHPDAGLQWLLNNPVGPVVHWGDGWWWGKLKRVKIDAEIVSAVPAP